MDWTLHVAIGIAIIGGGVYGVHLIWKHFISPTYNALVALSEFFDAQPTLLSIAQEFKPNNGDTLRDQVDALTNNGADITLRLGNIESSVERLVVCYGDWNGEERRNNG